MAWRVGQAAGGARGACGLLSAGLTEGDRRRAGNRATACVRPGATNAGGGPASDCAQHCMPQPAAQPQPESWPVGGDEPSAGELTQRLPVSKAAPAATDNGSSSACSATT